MTIVCAQNVLEINSKVLKRCWIIIESLKMIVCALYAREKWQSWNVNYYFLTTKFFDNSQSTHPHLPSKLGTSSWNNLNLCSKQLWCQIVFRHVGQIKSWGPNSFVHFGPHTAIYLTFAFDFTEHNSLNDLMTVLGACFLIVWRVHRFIIENRFATQRLLFQPHFELSFILKHPLMGMLILFFTTFFPFVCIFVLCLKMVFVGQITNILYTIWIIIYFHACRLS